MFKVFFIALLMVAFSLQADEAPKRYIVKLKEDKNAENLLREGLDGREVKVLSELPSIHAVIIEFTDGLEVDGDLEDENVEAIQEDRLIQWIDPIVGDDVETDSIEEEIPSGLARIGADSSSKVKATIAILDTGVIKDHPSLNVVKHISFVDNEDAYDQQGHGTHVAGTAAGRKIGVAPKAKIIALKVLNKFGQGNQSDIIKAIDWVTSHSDEIDVVNMSLSSKRGYGIDLMHEAIQKSVSKGVVYVVAAGNNGSNIYYGQDDPRNVTPASYPEVMTVSAMVDTDGLAGGFGSPSSYGPDDTLAKFSNYSQQNHPNNPVISSGGCIDVAAPGVDIFSTYLDKSFRKLSGTSMASPHVAGVVARYIAENRKTLFQNGKSEQIVYQIRQTLIDHSEPQVEWNFSHDAQGQSDYHEGLIRIFEREE